MVTWIGLLDCNNFFVSCERLFRPDLKGKPVLVLSSNDGCVVARSKEIKDRGIPMGVPYFKIKDILKDIDAVTFSSHFALYRDISRRVFEVMRKEIDLVQQYSVDEAFFLMEGSEKQVLNKVQKLKDRVEQEVGIPVSVGVALSKTQAKYANVLAKKTNGITLLSPTTWNDLTATIALSDLWGVGKSSTDAFKTKGLVTVAQYLRLERRQVQSWFGVVGERLWLELKGMPASTLSPQAEHQKSILHSRSFKETSSDLAVLQDAVAYHIREAGADLRSMGLKTGSLQVSLGTSRHGDFLLQRGSAVVNFTQPTDDSFLLLKAGSALAEQLFKPDVPYKKAGVLLTNFTRAEVQQASLFEDTSTARTNALMPVIDALNKRGKNSIVLGSHLRSKEWQSSQESRSPAYTTSWKDIAVARA